MEFSFLKLLLIVVVVFVVFGAGKLPKVMGDLGKGLRSFKDALNDKPEQPKIEEAKIDKDNKEA